MLSSGDFERYQDLYSKFGGDAIGLEDVSKVLRINRNYSKVFAHRLHRALCLVPLGRGKYILVDPERWMGLYLHSEKYPFLGELLKVLGVDINSTELMAVYGSWTRGEQKQESDIDVFLVSEGKRKDYSGNGGKFNIEYATPKSFLEELENDPLFIYSVLGEGDIIMGEELGRFFSELGYDIEKLQDKVSESIAMLRESKKLLRGELSSSTMETVCYISTLRLRTGFIAKSLVKGTKLSLRSLKREFLSYFRKKEEFGRIFNIYMAVRDEKTPGESVDLKALKNYVNAVEHYLSDTWRWLEDAKKKKAS